MDFLPGRFPLTTNFVPVIVVLLTLHCIIGVVAALIARRKQRNFAIWLPLGLLGGTPVFIIALRLPPQTSNHPPNQ